MPARAPGDRGLRTETPGAKSLRGHASVRVGPAAMLAPFALCAEESRKSRKTCNCTDLTGRTDFTGSIVAEVRRTETNRLPACVINAAMDGKALNRFVRSTRVTDRRRRVSRLAIGFALAAIVPATGALAVTEDVSFAAPQLDTDIQGDANALAPLPGMGSEDMDLVDLEPVSDEFSDIVEELGIGNASWYGPRFAGRPTANGETFNPREMTAAHRTLPFGSKVRVTSERTGKSIIVRINDRGPFHGNRVIDLSEAAAEAIGMKSRGQDSVALVLLQD